MLLLENVVMVILASFWFSTIPVAFLTLGRFLKNRNIFVEQDLRRIYNDPIIIFQITTRSATKTHVVKRGIDSIINSSLEINYNNYQICIITDDAKDKTTLNGVNCEVIVVDKKFTASAIKKGRALQYAVEHRRKTSKNIPKYWIFHMDDESYVTNQTIISLLKFIREGNAIASEGPIFYPLKFESANRLTAIAESIRPFTCYDCVSQMTNPPPLHMHGSNLLVRSDIEDSIGWNFGPTLAEDQIFGYKLYEKYGSKAMGWHGGILLEQPPLNIKDHFMQRRRWVLGTLQNMHRFPSVHKFKLMFKLMTYFMGFVSGVVSTILYFYAYIPKVLLLLSISEFNLDITSWFDKLMNTFYSEGTINSSINGSSPLDPTLGLILLFPYIMWLFSYQLGLFLNIRYLKISLIKRIMLHLQTLSLSFIIGLLETFPAFWAMLEYYIRDKTNRMKIIYDFYVIKK
ncbi:MAG TPA: glycosyltransferase family 2 protein [Nitrososphaeraceae archaeon]|nr:glycosyltransferase family 2 protein [Nitrososphaeraceae archaeon]